MESHQFGAALALAKKQKTPEEARKSLIEMGLITESGALAEHYRPKAKTSKKSKSSKA